MTLEAPPLRAVHEAAGATFTGFGGWEMPVEFDSIRTEHAAVRESVGRFDVSHMGELTVSGPDATELLQRLTTNDVTALGEGRGQYSMIVDEDGIILDDTVVYRLPASHEADYLLVPNAGHDGQMHDRWGSHRDEWGLDATVETVTRDLAMFAVQGPDAAELVAEAGSEAVRDLSRFEMGAFDVAGADALVARTGYTGEDGLELLVPTADAEAVWSALECQPCGLGARDTLRLEMGFLLSGQEFDPESNPRNPYEAGVGFSVALDTDFVGRDALAAVKSEGPAERLTGLMLEERGVPRAGYEVTDPGGDHLGTVTSGTMSPTLGEPIGLAYLPIEHRDPGTPVRVVVRDEPKEAGTRALPFLDR